jgi:hypothetical protein
MSRADRLRRRLWAATDARALGYGGTALVEHATGVSRPDFNVGGAS